jgi:hypothetical protein
MRCQDLNRELMTPTGTLSPGEMADHLATCRACAERSRRSDRFDRIWEATRPPEPSTQALDTLWARASAALDAPEPAVIPFPKARTGRSRWAVVAFLAAQAATVLVAASFLFRNDVGNDGQVASASLAMVVANVDQTLIVRIDDDGHRVENLDDSQQFAFASMADATPHDVFSALESMATK